jgi:hypothetical protein
MESLGWLCCSVMVWPHLPLGFGGGGGDLDSMIRGGEGIGSGREHGSSGGLLCGGDQVRLWGCHWGLTATDHRGGGGRGAAVWPAVGDEVTGRHLGREQQAGPKGAVCWEESDGRHVTRKMSRSGMPGHFKTLPQSGLIVLKFRLPLN